MILDHLVLVVNELESASRHFERMGFIVRPGGVHRGWGTHNALIGLAGSCYLELLAPVEPWRAAFYHLLQKVGALRLVSSGKSPIHARFIHSLALGEGLADFALLSNNLDEDLSAAQGRGLTSFGPFEGGRRRPDGKQIAWRTAIPGGGGLPFLIEDLTRRELRLPPPEASTHPNGVTGVAAISIACRDLDSSREEYQNLLGLSPEEEGQTGESGPSRTRFRLGESDLVLFQVPVLAMRRRAVEIHSIRLRTVDKSELFSLSFSMSKGFQLEKE